MTPKTVCRGPRIVFYSHDTFGLGHLRRSRALATAITQSDTSASALILTGSPVAGRFAFPDRVDHVRLPGVTKLKDGSYVSQTLGMDIDEVTAFRAGLIQSALDSYVPDLFIVDKEPTGFRGELMETLETLAKSSTTRCVLGLREILDEPTLLAKEWDRKGALDAIERFYDEIWVYGPQTMYDPTKGLDLSPHCRDRMHYTGYLRRTVSEPAPVPNDPYILITPGGGGDGAAMVDLVLKAYEAAPDLGPRAILVYGPFLSGDTRAAFEKRVKALNGRVTALGFESKIESLFANASGVVCMGGYNTFCEVLSFDRRAVIVPRTKPRKEQYIRATRARDLGLVAMLDEEAGELTPEHMIRAIRDLPSQTKPSSAGAEALMGGLTRVVERTNSLLGRPSQSQSAAE